MVTAKEPNNSATQRTKGPKRSKGAWGQLAQSLSRWRWLHQGQPPQGWVSVSRPSVPDQVKTTPLKYLALGVTPISQSVTLHNLQSCRCHPQAQSLQAQSAGTSHMDPTRLSTPSDTFQRRTSFCHNKSTQASAWQVLRAQKVVLLVTVKVWFEMHLFFQPLCLDLMFQSSALRNVDKQQTLHTSSMRPVL